MTYAIIGFGSVGQALASAFARKGIEVSVATTRDPESFASDAANIGPTVIPKKLTDVITADIIFLAVRFESYAEVAKILPTWQGKTIVDVTNAYGVSSAEIGGKSSAQAIARAFNGSKVVKGFNHLVASVLKEDPAVNGGKRVVFLSSDNESATIEIEKLAETLGFAPVSLGSLMEGGMLVQAHGNKWGELIFKDLVKLSK